MHNETTSSGPIATPAGVIYAHRGSTLLAPENTCLAYELALQHGADVLEIDVRLSADGQAMVFHDETLDRTTDGHGRVRDMLAADIQQLNAGHRFVDVNGKDWSDAGARIETLDALFTRFPNTAINIDIKDPIDKAADVVAACIKAAGRESDVNVGSFHAKTLERFRLQAPGVTTAATQEEVARLYFLQWLNPLKGCFSAAPLAYQYLQIPTRWRGIPLATAGFIREAHEQAIKVVYWTVNDPDIMHRLWRLGADGIVTDRPDLAHRAHF